MTQGIVSVARSGKTILKIIAGSNGMKAGAVVEMIRQKSTVPTVREAYEIAIRCGFGSTNSLVVLGEHGSYHKTGERLHQRYRRTFDQPKFNPRWKNGTADHVKVVMVEEIVKQNPTGHPHGRPGGIRPQEPAPRPLSKKTAATKKK